VPNWSALWRLAWQVTGSASPWPHRDLICLDCGAFHLHSDRYCSIFDSVTQAEVRWPWQHFAKQLSSASVAQLFGLKWSRLAIAEGRVNLHGFYSRLASFSSWIAASWESFPHSMTCLSRRCQRSVALTEARVARSPSVSVRFSRERRIWMGATGARQLTSKRCQRHLLRNRVAVSAENLHQLSQAGSKASKSHYQEVIQLDLKVYRPTLFSDTRGSEVKHFDFACCFFGSGYVERAFKSPTRHWNRFDYAACVSQLN